MGDAPPQPPDTTLQQLCRGSRHGGLATNRPALVPKPGTGPLNAPPPFHGPPIPCPWGPHQNQSAWPHRAAWQTRGGEGGGGEWLLGCRPTQRLMDCAARQRGMPPIAPRPSRPPWSLRSALCVAHPEDSQMETSQIWTSQIWKEDEPTPRCTPERDGVTTVGTALPRRTDASQPNTGRQATTHQDSLASTQGWHSVLHAAQCMQAAL